MAAQAQRPMIGNLEPFDPNSGLPFEAWVELFNVWMQINGVPEEPTQQVGHERYYLRESNPRRGLFLSSVGLRSYSHLHSMCLPDQPSQRSIPQLIRALSNKYAPPGLLPSNRLQFHSRNRKPNESVLDYITVLQELASKCNFGNGLQEALRDRLVCGINYEDTQRKLLSTENLTYEVARHTALQDDAVRAHSKRMAQATSVNVIQNPSPTQESAENTQDDSSSESDPQPPSKLKCPNCSRYHNTDKCPAKKWQCFRCGELGHIARKCPDANREYVAKEDVFPEDVSAEDEE